MPRAPVLPGRDVIDALTRLGFEKVRQRGSHVVTRRGSTGCVVPLHDEIKTGTLSGLLRQAEVGRDAFLSAPR